MNQGLLIGFGAIVLLVLAVPMLSALNKRPEPAAATAPQATSPAAEIPAAPAAPAPAAAPAVYVPTAADFYNTAWAVPTQMGQVTIQLQPGGVAVAQVPGMGNIQGNWSLQGNSLTASAMGNTISCQIQNGQLIYNGRPVQRVR